MKVSNILTISITASLVASTSINFEKILQLPNFNEKLSIWDENNELIKLHKNLIEIESISYNEAPVAHFLETYLTGKGLTVESFIIDPKTQRKNLFVYAGDVRETKILLTSHIDTVPPFFPYKVDGDDIYGRGSVDDKASVAAQITAFIEMLSSGDITKGDVALLLDVGEEKGGDGAQNAFDNLKIPWETVIFGEPTGFNLIIGHKGGAGGVLKATGKTGHSSIPELGVNAIDLLLDALQDMRKLEFPGSDKLGKSTLNIGTIEGGVAANVIPGDARASLLLRVATEDVDEIDAVFAQVLSQHPHVEWEEYNSHGPVFFDTNIEGYDKLIIPGGTDAATLRGNFEKYLIGPGTFDSIHAANEHINVHDLVKGVKVYKDLVNYKLK